MCEANVYLVRPDGTEQLLMERVDEVVPADGGLLLKSIFGDQKVVAARILKLALVEHRILLEEN